jgi:hypothetical protein
LNSQGQIDNSDYYRIEDSNIKIRGVAQDLQKHDGANLSFGTSGIQNRTLLSAVSQFAPLSITVEAEQYPQFNVVVANGIAK